MMGDADGNKVPVHVSGMAAAHLEPASTPVPMGNGSFKQGSVSLKSQAQPGM
jgi:hypothetical protein